MRACLYLCSCMYSAMETNKDPRMPSIFLFFFHNNKKIIQQANEYSNFFKLKIIFSIECLTAAFTLRDKDSQFKVKSN